MPDHRPLTNVALACRWEPVKERTWSGTPWMLRRALKELVDVEDIDVSPPSALRSAFRAASLRRSHGSWKSLWPHSRAAMSWNSTKLAREARRSQSQAVITIQDLGQAELPLFVVQDLSYGLLLSTFGNSSIPHFRSLPTARIRELHDRQTQVWRAATGLFPMSRWLAEDMLSSGIPEDKITVVPPGVNVQIPAEAPVPVRRLTGPHRLLFVGRDFDTKAGDQVVAAFRLLRARHGSDITLTVIGPKRWPLDDRPDGIEFRGPQSREEVDTAMAEHDLFVMPSRFEGFGIAFVEALARGLPCVGRDAFAMPEIIDPVSGGRLVSSEDVDELADAIDSALADDNLYEACRARALDRRSFYTWSRAAQQMVGVAESVVSR